MDSEEQLDEMIHTHETETPASDEQEKRRGEGEAWTNRNSMRLWRHGLQEDLKVKLNSLTHTHTQLQRPSFLLLFINIMFTYK